MNDEALNTTDYDSRLFQFIGKDGQEILPPDDDWIYEIHEPRNADGQTWWRRVIKKEKAGQ